MFHASWLTGNLTIHTSVRCHVWLNISSTCSAHSHVAGMTAHPMTQGAEMWQMAAADAESESLMYQQQGKEERWQACERDMMAKHDKLCHRSNKFLPMPENFAEMRLREQRDKNNLRETRRKARRTAEKFEIFNGLLVEGSIGRPEKASTEPMKVPVAQLSPGLVPGIRSTDSSSCGYSSYQPVQTAAAELESATRRQPIFPPVPQEIPWDTWHHPSSWQ